MEKSENYENGIHWVPAPVETTGFGAFAYHINFRFWSDCKTLTNSEGTDLAQAGQNEKESRCDEPQEIPG